MGLGVKMLSRRHCSDLNGQGRVLSVIQFLDFVVVDLIGAE